MPSPRRGLRGVPSGRILGGGGMGHLTRQEGPGTTGSLLWKRFSPLGARNQIDGARELTHRVHELQLAVLPLVDEEALALGEASFVPDEIAQDRADRLLGSPGV